MSAIQTVPTTNVSIPEIFTANCYFWTPSTNANGRRSNEERHQVVAEKFFNAIGLTTTRNGNSVNASGHGLDVSFSYNETCGNVYKSLEVYRDGKKSNITAIKKLVCCS